MDSFTIYKFLFWIISGLLTICGYFYIKDQNISDKNSRDILDIKKDVEALKITPAVYSRELDLIKSDLSEKIDEAKKDVRDSQVKHEGLQKIVENNYRAAIESTHDIRTIIGTEYVTRKELRDSLEGVNILVRELSREVIKLPEITEQRMRRLLEDMGMLKK